jgi:hypothetical protein
MMLPPLSLQRLSHASALALQLAWHGLANASPDMGVKHRSNASNATGTML